MKEIQLNKKQANIIYPEDITDEMIIVGRFDWGFDKYWAKLHRLSISITAEARYAWISLENGNTWAFRSSTIIEALDSKFLMRAYVLDNIIELSDLYWK